MVSVDMAAQVRYCAGIESETSLPMSDKTFLDLGTHTEKGLHPEDQFNIADDHAPKVRKPYTITKQRERWTEDEHKKFLEALKLYGRAWRKIEEHVGSKTAVQIRSHAQKFFSKVARDSSNADDEKPIEIPPPRPKKKPMHAYPRKFVCPIKTGTSMPDKPTNSASSSLSASEAENQSPKSMLSTIGSDLSGLPNVCLSPSSGAQIGSKYEQLSPEEQVSLELELFPQRDSLAKDDSTEMASSHHLRLFGKTLLVSDHHSPDNTTSRTSKLELFERNEENCFSPFGSVPIEVHPSCSEYIWSVLSQRLPLSLYGGSIENDLYYTPMICEKPQPEDPSCPVSLQWLTHSKKASISTQEVHNPTPVKSRLSSDAKEMPNKDEEKEGSSTGSNTDLCCTTAGEKTRGADSYVFERKSNEQSSPSYKLSKQLSTKSANSGKGFVPYQRCLGKRASTLIPNGTADEPKYFRARLCL